jgi:hypothetical protein
MQEKLKKIIKHLKNEELAYVLDYIEDPTNDLNLCKSLLFRTVCEYGNETIFNLLIEKKEIIFDDCQGKSLISATNWEREYFVEKLLKKCKVDPINRTFKAYRLALNKKNEKIINLFEKEIFQIELIEHQRLELVRSFIIGNQYEKFKNYIENNKCLTKKQYLSILVNMVISSDKRFLSFMLEKNKELNIFRVSQIFKITKTHNKYENYNLIIDYMNQEDYSYGNEIIIRDIVKNNNYEIFNILMRKYEFDFSLFDNKILKEALKKGIPEEFFKKILYNKTLIKSFNKGWYNENKKLVLNSKHSEIIVKILRMKNIEIF